MLKRDVDTSDQLMIDKLESLEERCLHIERGILESMCSVYEKMTSPGTSNSMAVCNPTKPRQWNISDKSLGISTLIDSLCNDTLMSGW